MSAWRTPAPCVDCPFNTSGPGLALRKSLRAGRWRSILSALRSDRHFFCHKTTVAAEEEDEASVPQPGARVCAGSLAWSEAHGVSQNYCRIAERLDAIFSRERNTP